MSKPPPPAPTANSIGPCPTLIPICRTPRQLTFTQNHRITRPPRSIIQMVQVHLYIFACFIFIGRIYFIRLLLQDFDLQLRSCTVRRFFTSGLVETEMRPRNENPRKRKRNIGRTARKNRRTVEQLYSVSLPRNSNLLMQSILFD